MDPRTRTLVIGDSHVRRLMEFMQRPPVNLMGSVQLSMGLEGDLEFLGKGGRITQGIKDDWDNICRISPHVMILMVGGNDLCNPATSALEVASAIHDLALSLSEMKGHRVFVASIPPRLSYPNLCPEYPDLIHNCNLILRNLLEVENNISYFKLRGLFVPNTKVFIRDGIHFNGFGNYKVYRAVQGPVCLGLKVMDRLRGGKPGWQ